MTIAGLLSSVRCCEKRRVPISQGPNLLIGGKTGTSASPPLLKKSLFTEPAGEAVDDDPPCQTDEEIASEHKEKGNAFFKSQDFAQAVISYGKAIELRPQDVTLWLNRSIAYRQLKQWNASLEDATCACELQPSNVKAQYGKALALQQLGRPEEAADACEIGLKEHPENKALVALEKAVRAEKVLKKKERVVLPKVEPACPASQVAGTEEEVKAAAEQAQIMSYKWQGRVPSKKEREDMKKMILEVFLQKYRELKTTIKEHETKKSVLQTDQYEASQKLTLQLEGGHQPMPRPEGIKVPDTYMAPVGVLTVEELAEYGVQNKDGRYLVSVYGDLFDVSDRPDKYGPKGPYWELTGKDITWGLFTGVDSPVMCNRFYDLYKAKDMGKDKIAGLCSWLAWYETDYGKAVGQLEPYTHEWDLPTPPLEEINDACSVM